MEGDELTEYALRRGDGTMDIRSPALATPRRLYPVEHWAKNQRALGARVFYRKVVRVEDWSECRSATCEAAASYCHRVDARAEQRQPVDCGR
jgi:hypothetical protein